MKSWEKTFLIAFWFSLAIHSVILLQNSNLGFFSTRQKEQKVEVSYLKDQKRPSPALKEIVPKRERQEFLKFPTKITIDNHLPPQYSFQMKEEILKRNQQILSSETEVKKPAFIKPDIIAVKKRITLAPVTMDKMNNPSYISYYQIVREKIRRAAYQNYSRTEVGEVYLSFIIANDGILKEVQLVDEKSTTKTYLKEIALKSIKDASAFPAFPKELDYPQLSFNVIISFEIE